MYFSEAISHPLLPGQRPQRFPFLYFLQHFFLSFFPCTMASGKGNTTAEGFSGLKCRLSVREYLFILLRLILNRLQSKCFLCKFHNSMTSKSQEY